MNKDITVLTTLAIEINALDDQANHHAGQAVVYATRCGKKLNEAKALCRHGEFLPWLEANCHVKTRQAQNYMKLAIDMPQLLEESNTQRVAYLPSMRQAIELLNAPDDVKDTVNSRLEAGEDVTVKEIRGLKAAAERLEKRNLELSVSIKQAAELNKEIKDQRDRILEANQTEITHIRSALRRKEVEANHAHERAELLKQNARMEVETENGKKIEALKKEIAATRRQLEKAEQDMDKNVRQGVDKKLYELQSVIQERELTLRRLNEHADSLRATVNSLDGRVGTINAHQEYLKQCRQDLLHIKASVDMCIAESDVPLEVVANWQQIAGLMAAVSEIIFRWITGSNLQKLIDPKI